VKRRCEGAEFIQGAIASSSDEKKGIIASIIGLVVLLFGATGVFTQLQDALNTVWEVEPENQTFWASLLSRWTSFTMVLGIGFLLLVSLFLSTFLSLVSDAVPPPFGIGTAVLEIVHNVVTLGVITALFAMMYRLLPGVKLPWKDVWLGAALTAFLFVLGKFLLGLYLGKAAVGSSYGAAGTAVVLLVWVYYSSQILLFGAECTQAVAKLRKRKIELRPGYHLTERAAWELEGQPA
jgi:membrane protein